MMLLRILTLNSKAAELPTTMSASKDDIKHFECSHVKFNNLPVLSSMPGLPWEAVEDELLLELLSLLLLLLLEDFLLL